MRSTQNPKDLFTAETTATEGELAHVKSYRHIVLEVSMVAYTGTIKFAGSMKESKPDLSASASPTNPIDNIQIKELDDATAFDGDTGISGTAETSVKLYEANVNALTWIGAVTSSVTGGAVTVRVIPFND